MVVPSGLTERLTGPLPVVRPGMPAESASHVARNGSATGPSTTPAGDGELVPDAGDREGDGDARMGGGRMGAGRATPPATTAVAIRAIRTSAAATSRVDGSPAG